MIMTMSTETSTTSFTTINTLNPLMISLLLFSLSFSSLLAPFAIYVPKSIMWDMKEQFLGKTFCTDSTFGVLINLW